VRVKGQLVKTVVFADSPVHARLILQYQFGMDSIVAYPTAITEVATIKPLTPDQQRIKSMQDRVKQGQAAVKAERARQRFGLGRLHWQNPDQDWLSYLATRQGSGRSWMTNCGEWQTIN